MRFLLEHEPAAVLAHLTFAPGDRVLTEVGDAPSPALNGWLGEADAIHAGDWIARVLRSYVLMPEPTVDLTDAAARHHVPFPTSSSPGSRCPPPSKAGSPMASNLEIIGRDDVDDIDAILAMTNTDVDEVGTLCAANATPSSPGTTSTVTASDKLYEKAKKSQ